MKSTAQTLMLLLATGLSAAGWRPSVVQTAKSETRSTQCRLCAHRGSDGRHRSDRRQTSRSDTGVVDSHRRGEWRILMRHSL
jgi:hypothetical protein